MMMIGFLLLLASTFVRAPQAEGQDTAALAVAIAETLREEAGLTARVPPYAPVATGPFYVDGGAFVAAFGFGQGPEVGVEVQQALSSAGYTSVSLDTMIVTATDSAGRTVQYFQHDGIIGQVASVDIYAGSAEAIATLYYTYTYVSGRRGLCYMQLKIAFSDSASGWHRDSSTVLRQC